MNIIKKYEFKLPTMGNAGDALRNALENTICGIDYTTKKHELFGFQTLQVNIIRAKDLLKLPVEERKTSQVIRQEFIEKLEIEEKCRFFNQSCCNADINIWGKYPIWNALDEGVALLLGKDPINVTWEKIKAHIHISPFAKKFAEIRETVKRYIASKQLAESMTPGEFLAWAQRMNYSIPPHLMNFVDEFGIHIGDSQTLFKKMEEKYKKSVKANKTKDQLIAELEQKILELEAQSITTMEEIKETERQSLYKIIATMAYYYAGYVPSDKKSPIPTEIAREASVTIGEGIEADTTRKWLRLATDRFPKII